MTQPKNTSGEWIVIAPDGTEFTGPTPLKAAFPASKYRLEIDPVAAAKFAEIINQIADEGEAERERCMRDYGTLNCPACGGSGHIADAMAAQPVQPGWMPIASAPKDGADVLLFCDRVHIGDYLPGVYEWNAGAWWIEGGQITGNPTHWMPLPQPPIHDTKEQT